MSEFRLINNHLVELEKELDRLKTATDQIATAKDAANEVIDACQSVQLALKTVVESAEETTEIAQGTIRSLQEKASKTIGDVRKEALDTLQKVLKANKELIEEINTVLKTISEIDFPSRLDKLDNTVSAVNISIQNLTTVCNNLSQKNDELITRISSFESRNSEKLETLKQELKQEMITKFNFQRKLIFGGFIGIFVVLLMEVVLHILL